MFIWAANEYSLWHSKPSSIGAFDKKIETHRRRKYARNAITIKCIPFNEYYAIFHTLHITYGTFEMHPDVWSPIWQLSVVCYKRRHITMISQIIWFVTSPHPLGSIYPIRFVSDIKHKIQLHRTPHIPGRTKIS